MQKLYPDIEPYNSGFLPVSELHTLYFEECGNPQGIPIVFLHGGPGGGVEKSYRRYFDPKKWRLILFDQRACGKSKPFAELRENTTWDLVADLEKIRSYLEVDKWAVFGGSWGSTLALAYSQSYPGSCLALFLRGIFMLRDKEIQWFYQEGASRLFPDYWEKYLAPIPEEERSDLLKAYYKRLTSDNRSQQIEAAKAWSTWEAATSKLLPDANLVSSFSEEDFALAFARIESHYFINKGFFKTPNQLLENIDKIRHIPSVIVHGRYDVVCPVENAWELHKVWPEADLHIVTDAGHALSESGICSILMKALDSFKLL